MATPRRSSGAESSIRDVRVSRIGVITNPRREEALSARDKLEAWCESHGHVSKRIAAPQDCLGLEVVVALGGDGTMLRALELSLVYQTPVIGVNFGHLGYLTEVEPDELFLAIERFLSGGLRIEERTTLEIRLHRLAGASPGERFYAVNEVVVEKSHSGNVVKLGVAIAGEPFLDYEADGIIVSSPTGSTAYSFSARGPVVSPRLSAMVLTPVSPHMLFDRAMVLQPDEEVEIRVLGGQDATLMVDGVNREVLKVGESITCRASSLNARLVKFEERDFRSILKAKFGLANKDMGEL